MVEHAPEGVCGAHDHGPWVRGESLLLVLRNGSECVMCEDDR